MSTDNSTTAGTGTDTDTGTDDRIRYVDLARHDCNGYELFTDPDESHGRGVSITHHRLIAYAHHGLEDLRADLEVDHLTPVPWLNYAANLDVVEPDEHAARTRERERRRKQRRRAGREGV